MAGLCRFALNFQPWTESKLGFLADAFGAGSIGVLAGFVFALAPANLLLDFFRHEVDGGVEIAFAILGKKVWTRFGEAHGAFELAFRGFGGIVFQGDAGIDGKTVEMFELIDPDQDVLFNGIGESHVVQRENHFHINSLRRLGQKIQ
ncbi:MAG: hypothetical protein JWR26_811 [Pedosphaera sp.]|nr:hypothetical protein [Pedosphaera sp.]